MLKKRIRNVVICGSMSFYDEMLYIKKQLGDRGVTALVPDSDEIFYERVANTNDKEAIDKFKRMASRAHISKIWQVPTRAILVVNNRKRGIDNYIGANSLAEIALAFAKNKKIFLLYDFPALYNDELYAWGAIPLKGDLEELISYTKAPIQEQYYLPGIDLDDG